MDETRPGDAQAGLVRLVNLTEHKISLDARLPPEACPGPDALTAPSPLRIRSAGAFARVDDPRARLGDSWLNVPARRVLLTRLRRSRRLVDLPPPALGTRYPVSRATAHAPRRREDLAFPLTGIRDTGSRVPT